jgi:hypothetical protein
MIDLLEARDITKREFIEKTHEFIMCEAIKPFRMDKTNCVKAALCNYQYFNTLAKKAFIDAEDFRFRDSSKSVRFFEMGHDYYLKKEGVTKNMLEIIGYDNVSAYFLRMNAKNLENEVFEIVLKDERRAIFHSVDKMTLNRLRKNGAFSEDARDSVICNYVNEKY